MAPLSLGNHLCIFMAWSKTPMWQREMDALDLGVVAVTLGYSYGDNGGQDYFVQIMTAMHDMHNKRWRDFLLFPTHLLRQN